MNNKKQPLVSIVTATYNLIKSGRKDYILQNIESVHNQTYKNVEHIIIDGASTDGTLELLRPYEEKGWIKIYSEPDQGIYDAMNKGIDKASGEYIAMINSDDWLMPNGLSEIFENSDFDNQDAFFCAVNVIDNKTQNKIKTEFPRALNKFFYFWGPQSTQGWLIKKSVYQKFKGHDLTYKIAADWNIFLKMLEDKTLTNLILYHSLANFRLGGISDSQTDEEIKKHLNERAQLISSYFPELTKEQAAFCAEMRWKNTDEIISFFNNFSENSFSEKFKEALSDFMDDKKSPLNGTLLPIFNGNYSKESMIQNIKKLPVLESKLKNDDVAICLASDAGYEPHLYVAIKSIINQVQTSATYYFYILDGGLKNKQNFLNLETDKIKFNFIDMRGQFLASYESRHLSRATYYRLAVFHVFQKFDKIIYIDADSYLLDDIYNLFHFNICNKPIAASRDSLTWQKSWQNNKIKHLNFTGNLYDYEKSYLKHSAEKIKNYFNAGVIILNLKNINIKEKQKKLDELLLQDYYCHDQDILNLLFDEKETFILPRAWNYFNIQNFISENDFTNEEEKEYYFKASVSPKLLAFIIKPWTIENINCDFSNLYWNILKESPYYDQVISKLQTTTLQNTCADTSISFNKKLKISLFGIPVFKISKNQTKTKYKLFSFLPLYKIKQKGNKSKHYLFGFIPFLKIKQ